MKTNIESYNDLTDEQIIAARERLDRIMNDRGLDDPKSIYGTVTVDVTPIVQPIKTAGNFVMDCISGVFILFSVLFWAFILFVAGVIIFG